MSDDFLSRWSRMKRAARVPAAEAAPPPVAPTPQARDLPAAAAQGAPAPVEPQPLPPVESLSFDSDFTAFMKPEVGEGLKRQALKTLFQDPRFNVMDGLDVYIDDYSKPDPLPDGWLEKMNLSRLGDYRPPEEETPPAAPPAARTAEKAAPDEALATRGEDIPSDTLEPPAVPPQVSESPSRE